MNLTHPPYPPQVDPVTGRKVEIYKVSEWRDRVLDLCEFEITHQYFGLSYTDLMNLDTAEFEDIEDRVHKIAEQKTQNMNKMKAEMSGKPMPSSTNLLKDLHR